MRVFHPAYVYKLESIKVIQIQDLKLPQAGLVKLRRDERVYDIACWRECKLLIGVALESSYDLVNFLTLAIEEQRNEFLILVKMKSVGPWMQSLVVLD